jgi:hypothetical protein
MWTATDLISLIRFETVKREFVLFRPDGDCFQPQFIGCPKNTDRNFRAVGNKDF